MNNIDVSVLKSKTVLFVDDEENARRAMERMLLKRFKTVWLAEDGEEAMEKYMAHDPDIIITDIEMPRMNGLLLLDAVKERNPEEPVMILTAFADEAHRAQKADAILIKPIDRRELLFNIVRLFG